MSILGYYHISEYSGSVFGLKEEGSGLGHEVSGFCDECSVCIDEFEG